MSENKNYSLTLCKNCGYCGLADPYWTCEEFISDKTYTGFGGTLVPACMHPVCFEHRDVGKFKFDPVEGMVSLEHLERVAGQMQLNKDGHCQHFLQNTVLDKVIGKSVEVKVSGNIVQNKKWWQFWK